MDGTVHPQLADTQSTLQSPPPSLSQAQQQQQPADPPFNTLPSGAPSTGPFPAESPQDATSVTPVKRKPGRPKGSGKKLADPNAPPKIKRPVGRPRKDGLPAGSLSAPRRYPIQPRVKRAPGQYATLSASSAPDQVPAAQFLQWIGASASAPVATKGARRTVIDPRLMSENWTELVKSNPDAFLGTLLATLDAPNPTSTVGPTVEDAFKSHLVSLAPVQYKGVAPPSTIPSLYSILKTFWLPSSPAYFVMTASATTARTPSEHRFLYWDPQPLVFNGIACPICSSPLANRGRIRTGPIKIYDLGKPFFIIACEYACTSAHCTSQPGLGDGRRFSSVDLSILQALPPALRQQFPAHVLHGGADIGCTTDVWCWRPMGVSKELWDMVRSGLRAGVAREAILQMIRGIQHGVPDEPLQARQDRQDQDEEMNSIQEPIHAVPTGSGQPEAGPSNEAEQPLGSAWIASQGPVEYANGEANGSESAPQSSQDQDTDGDPNAAQAGQFVYHAAPEQYPTRQSPYQYSAVPSGSLTPALQTPMRMGEGSTSQIAFSAIPESERRARHCVKCGSADCKGKGGTAFCQNPCQDCGALACKGRNSKRPNRTCANAWDD